MEPFENAEQGYKVDVVDMKFRSIIQYPAQSLCLVKNKLNGISEIERDF